MASVFGTTLVFEKMLGTVNHVLMLVIRYHGW